MRVLFFLEPLVMHSRPLHYWAWLEYSATVQRAFAGAGRSDYQFRFLTNEALAGRATAPQGPARSPSERGQGLPPELVVSLEQEAVRGLFDAPSSAILEALHRRTASEAQQSAYAVLVEQALAGFVPDVIITRTPAAFLSLAFPEALILGTELGPFSRRPYPLTTFYDARGLWADSIPGACADELLARDVSAQDQELLVSLRGHYGAYHERASPFTALCARLRKRFRRLALLPLQFGGESGFDLNGPFRNQGEYLFHVLERMPADVGVLVVEHPTALWLGDRIDEETQAWARERFPNLIFIDYRAAESAGQLLVRHVDYVVCVSSSIGLQALFWQKPLVRVGWSHLAPYATFESVSAVDPAVAPEDGRKTDGALAWLWRHYYAPESLALRDPEWLDGFWRGLRARRDAGLTGLSLYEPIAPLAALRSALTPPLPLPPPSSAPVDDLLQNGALTSWPLGDGPFTSGGPCAAAWELVPTGPGLRVTRQWFADDAPESVGATGALGEFYVRLERDRAGGPTFFLQRVADATRLQGAFVALSFWARSDELQAQLSAYFYQQLAHPDAACQGTAAQVFNLTSEWRRYSYVTTLPLLGSEPLGQRHHTEVVLCLVEAAVAVSVDVAWVTLGPGGIGE